MARYSVTAALLGAGWFVVLLIPRITRTWLLEDVWTNLACLIITSVAVSVLCRRTIERAETTGDHLIRAALIPYLGCLVFLSLWTAIHWGQTLLYGGLANLHDTMSLYLMGMTAALLSCFIVVPYGLLCQYVMNAAGSRMS